VEEARARCAQNHETLNPCIPNTVPRKSSRSLLAAGCANRARGTLGVHDERVMARALWRGHARTGCMLR